MSALSVASAGLLLFAGALPFLFTLFAAYAWRPEWPKRRATSLRSSSARRISACPTTSRSSASDAHGAVVTPI